MMKQYLKYGLLVAFILLLSSVTMKAAGVIDTPVDDSHGEYFFSQAHSTHNFERFQIYYLNTPCEQGHSNVLHIPADKCLLRLFSRFREHKAVNPFYLYDALNLPIYGLSNPIAYYIYGLRKIVV